MAGLRRLSKHFVERWAERVGGLPTLAAVRAIVRSSAPILHCKRLYDPGVGCEVVQPAVYWHPELDMVLLIDHIHATAISVMSKEAWLERCRS